MRIHKIILNTAAEGPGKRACIWVQGCSHRCNGCFATHLWNKEEGKEVSTEEIIQKLNTVIDTIDGITFLGGEPMEQADELWKIAEYVKKAGKNVLTFTGYTYDELTSDKSQTIAQFSEKQRNGIDKLLKYTDLLADGPFVKEKVSYDRPLLGSSNQRFVYLSNEISPRQIEEYHNSFEFRINKSGQLQVNGMGDVNKLKDCLNKINGGKYEIESI